MGEKTTEVDDIELSAEEWQEVKEEVDAESREVEERFEAVMGMLRDECPRVVFHELDEAIGKFVRSETEAAFAFGLAVGRGQQSPDAWVEEFERLAQERGVQIGKRGRKKEKAATLAQLAFDLGVSVRTARRRLKRVKEKH